MIFTVRYAIRSLATSEHETLTGALEAVSAAFAGRPFDTATGGDDSFTLCFVHIADADFTAVVARIYKDDTPVTFVEEQTPPSGLIERWQHPGGSMKVG